MDFADSPEHAAFRAEFRHWLEANLPPEICADDAADQRVAPDRETLAVPDAARWHHRVLGARQYTIAGGTSEIQRNIIGERILGLPKG
jgi:hypothetical protein